MEAELLQLAQRAVAALEAANSTSWVEVAQLAVSGGGLLAILVGLKRVGEAGARRDREIDVMAENMRQGVQALKQQDQALERQGQAMTQAFTQQGQALERQGQAMTQALAQQGQALERQGQVLAELLRRSDA